MQKNSLSEPFQRQRLRLLFQQARPASTIAGIGAVACAVIFFNAAPGPGPIIWLACVLLATALRFGLYRKFVRTDIKRVPESTWLRDHGRTATLAGIAWGCLPLVSLGDSPMYVHVLQIVVPGFVLMAAITSYGIYYSQYMILWASTGGVSILSGIVMSGTDGIADALLFALFMPILALTAKRYSESLNNSLKAADRMEKLVKEVTQTNDELQRRNSVMVQQQDLIEQEEALAQHVFTQLTLGGDHEIPGVHSWNQPMGTLSGDLTHKATGPDGQTYVLLADFTGHGLPAALGALPASSVFLAMAAKGLPVETIAIELNNKLHELLPVGYFCCAVLLELDQDRRTAHVWNGGLPPVLISRHGETGFERIPSHSLPLGVVGAKDFEATAHELTLRDGDLLYAYTDGLTEAENLDGEMWGLKRLEDFLQDEQIESPKLPALIDAVLEYVNLAPASDDVSVLEVEATPRNESKQEVSAA